MVHGLAKTRFCDSNHSGSMREAVVLEDRWRLRIKEIAMNTSHWVWHRCLGSPTRGPLTEIPDCLELVANRWHEESKRRYEELAYHCLELAEQRQRCA
jgi:hypothetical protein